MWLEVVSFGAAIAAGALVGGIIGAYMRDYELKRRVLELEVAVVGLVNSVKGQRGNMAKEEQNAAVQAVMLQAKTIWEGEGEQNEKIKKIVALAMQNPQVLQGLMKMIR